MEAFNVFPDRIMDTDQNSVPRIYLHDIGECIVSYDCHLDLVS